MAILRSFKEIDRYIKKLELEQGHQAEWIRLLNDRVTRLVNETRYNTTFSERTKTGTVVVTHGTTGGGTLPGSVGVDQRGELQSAVFTMAEGHAHGGTLIVQEASALAEEVDVI